MSVNNRKSNNGERLYPVLLVFLGLSHFLFFGQTDAGPISYISTAIVLTVLLNTTHIGFSFSSMFFLPASRSWIKHHFNSSLIFFSFLLSASLLFISLIAWSFGLFSTNPNIDHPNSIIVMNLVMIVSIWHNMAQSMGISLIHNYKLKTDPCSLSPKDLREMDLIGLLERRVVKIVYVLTIFIILRNSDLIPSLNQFHLPHLKEITFIVKSALIIYLLFRIKRCHIFKNSEKLEFCLRYTIWPLVGLNYIGGYIFQALHGFEYLMLNNKMRSNSEMNTSQKRTLDIAFLSLGLIFFVFGVFEIGSIGSLLIDNYHLQPQPIIIITSISTGLFLTHLIWDRYFFRFRSEIGKKTVGKVLL